MDYAERDDRMTLAMDLVDRLARFERTKDDVLEHAEYVSVGYDALLEAAERFDPEGPATFRTYARRCMWRSMKDAARRRRVDYGRRASLDQIPESYAVSAEECVEDHDRLRQAVAKLERAERRVITALYVHGSPLSDRRRMRLPKATAHRVHHCVLEKLRASLGVAGAGKRSVG